MIVLNLKAKNCMSHLLLKPTFDEFSLIEGEITTFNKFSFDGYIHKDFYEEALENEFSYWKDLREFCFSIIKGKRTPLNFKYDGIHLQCVTGTSMNMFTMDKSIEKAWDEYVKTMFSEKGIEWDSEL